MAMEVGNCLSIYTKIKGLKKEEVDNLLKWCEMQQFLPKITEKQIINFLHSNNFNLEAAQRCIDDFFTLRTLCPAIFTKRNPNELDLNVGINFPFGEKTTEGCKITMIRLIDTNPNKFIFTQMLKIFDMSTMLILNEEGPSEGHIFIFDLTGVSFKHLTKVNLWYLKKFLYYLQECMPLKIKALHFINIGNVMDKIMFLIRPFLKKEIVETLYTHQTMESIYKMIPKEYFPRDYLGGLAPSIAEQQRAEKEGLLDNVKFFQEEEKQVVIEKLRPEKPKNSGIFSTFKGLFKS